MTSLNSQLNTPLFSGFSHQVLGTEPLSAGKNPVIDPVRVLYSFEEFKFFATSSRETGFKASYTHDDKVRRVEKAFAEVLKAKGVKIIQNNVSTVKNAGWMWTYGDRDLLVAFWDRDKAATMPLNEMLTEVRKKCPELKIEIWLASSSKPLGTLPALKKKPEKKPESVLPKDSLLLSTEVIKIKAEQAARNQKNKAKAQQVKPSTEPKSSLKNKLSHLLFKKKADKA